MHEFETFARGLGLRPRTVMADGKWRRCPTDEHPRKRNGAYKLLPGGTLGFVQDWASMDKPATWKAGKHVDEFDINLFRQAQKKADDDQHEAIAAAQAFYDRAEPLRDGHPYLEAHGLDVSGCEGLRVDGTGWLVVPAYRGREVVSVQRIAPDGTKRFWRGAPVAGTTYTIRRRTPAMYVICEGLATGLACWMAEPTAQVIVAWNAGNLAQVMAPRGLVVVAADNDKATHDRTGTNPGLEAGKRAAERIGCGVACPVAIKGTDWCDYLSEHMAQRLTLKGKWTSDDYVRRVVLAEIRTELRRHARLVS